MSDEKCDGRCPKQSQTQTHSLKVSIMHQMATACVPGGLQTFSFRHEQGDTATGYRAVRSGVEGHQIGIMYALIWRVPTFRYFTGSTWSDRPGIGRGIDY
eukprot:6206467-Pleurochrysis_carterae.AAC.1